MRKLIITSTILIIMLTLLTSGCKKRTPSKKYHRTTFAPKEVQNTTVQTPVQNTVLENNKSTILTAPTPMPVAEPIPTVVPIDYSPAVASTTKVVHTKTTMPKNPFSNGGSVRCSLHTPVFNDVCDYKLFYRDGVTKIFIENISEQNAILYRTLYFDGQRFSTKTREALSARQTEDMRHHIIHIGKEYYKILHKSLVEEYK